MLVYTTGVDPDIFVRWAVASGEFAEVEDLLYTRTRTILTIPVAIEGRFLLIPAMRQYRIFWTWLLEEFQL